MTNCGRKPIPTILDTDIGNDIDDTWALGMLLNSPEFDLKLVLTSTGDARYRARVAARFLEACGRDDIPVGIGVSRADDSPETMHEYADSYRPEQYSGGFWEDGVGRALELIAAEPELTVIGIAPLTTLAELCRRDERLRRTVRIFPHRMEGEGHFLALLKKGGKAPAGADAGNQTRHSAADKAFY